MKCVGFPSWEVDPDGAMAPLSGTPQWCTVLVVAAQVNQGLKGHLLLSPCLSWHGIFWSWLSSLSCREASSLELKWPPEAPGLLEPAQSPWGWGPLIGLGQAWVMCSVWGLMGWRYCLFSTPPEIQGTSQVAQW